MTGEETIKICRNRGYTCRFSYGRAEDFAGCRITVVTPIRTYTMTRQEDAPKDSNLYLEV